MKDIKTAAFSLCWAAKELVRSYRSSGDVCVCNRHQCMSRETLSPAASNSAPLVQVEQELHAVRNVENETAVQFLHT